MLLELRIGRLGLVNELVLPVEPGLTVLTGETGAGKSMIAGALSLLQGGRVPRDFVREGEEDGWIEAVFDLTESPTRRNQASRAGVRIGEDGILVLRRELKREGRGRVLINGLVSSLAVLETLGPALLTVQSQHQQLELSRSGFARDTLDRALGLDDARDTVRDAWDAWRDAVKRLERLRRDAAAAAEQADVWRYQRDELSAAGLDADEEPELAERLAILQDTARLRQAAAAALALLSDDGSTVEMLGKAEGLLPDLSVPVRAVDEARSALLSAQDSAAEAAAGLERFLDGLDLDGGDLDTLQGRKALYEELRRKYRREVPELMELLTDLDERLSRHDDADASLARAADDEASARSALQDAAAALSERRRAGAPRLSRDALGRIRPLALPDLDLAFSIERRRDDGAGFVVDGEPCAIDARGADDVVLNARTNPGEPVRPLDAIASGGERSRIHLGLTSLLRPADEPPLLLLDEIDAGLGMDAARPVARLLDELASQGQVVCITHLPTMAVHGRRHWLAVKLVRDGRTRLDVRSLGNDERLLELERLLGGAGSDDEDDTRRGYAEGLLAEAWPDGLPGIRH